MTIGFDPFAVGGLIALAVILALAFYAFTL